MYIADPHKLLTLKHYPIPSSSSPNKQTIQKRGILKKKHNSLLITNVTNTIVHVSHTIVTKIQRTVLATEKIIIFKMFIKKYPTLIIIPGQSNF